MLSSYCTCLSSVLGETFVRHHQRNLIQLIAATLVRISRPGKHFLIETEDEDRCLYSYSGPVQVPASYPPPFSGKPSEDFYKFKEKMLDALLTNQIREKDKVEVLRRNLTGNAKVFVGEYCENINKAFEDLQMLYVIVMTVLENFEQCFFQKMLSCALMHFYRILMNCSFLLLADF